MGHKWVWKAHVLLLHHWVGQAVVLLQSLTVQAPRYVYPAMSDIESRNSRTANDVSRIEMETDDKRRTQPLTDP